MRPAYTFYQTSMGLKVSNLKDVTYKGGDGEWRKKIIREKPGHRKEHLNVFGRQ